MPYTACFALDERSSGFTTPATRSATGSSPVALSIRFATRRGSGPAGGAVEVVDSYSRLRRTRRAGGYTLGHAGVPSRVFASVGEYRLVPVRRLDEWENGLARADVFVLDPPITGVDDNSARRVVPRQLPASGDCLASGVMRAENLSVMFELPVAGTLVIGEDSVEAFHDVGLPPDWPRHS